MASYFASLRIALKTIQDSDPNAIALNVGQYIPPLKDDPSAITQEQIAKHLSGYARFEQPNLQQLQLLAEVVRIAQGQINEPEEQTALPETVSPPVPSVPEVALPQPEQTEAVPAPSEPTPVETEAQATPVAPPVPQPIPVEPAAVKVNYDPNDFLLFAPLHGSNSVITVNPLGSGQQQVSWPGAGDGSKIYLISASNDAIAVSPAVANFKIITADNTCVLPERYRFIAIFEFDEPKQRGRVFGTIETIGSIAEFELDPFASQVNMRWQTDDLTATVRIARSATNEKLPTDISPNYFIYEALSSSGNTHVDPSVQSGDKFEYRIWLERVSAGRVSESDAITKTVTIPGNIPKVQDFKVRTSEKGPNFVDISYRELDQPNAKVLIYQVQGAPSNDLMAAIADTENKPITLDLLKSPRVEGFLGRQIIAPVPRAIEGIVTYEAVPLPTEEIGSRTFIPVVCLGDFARISDTDVVDQIDDVEKATIFDRVDFQMVRVEVPKGAEMFQVWHTSANQNWEAIADTRPDRTVSISEEFRPNGGILFAKKNPTLPDGIKELGVDPARLFIRSATIFKGVPHPSAKAFALDHKGRIEIHVKISEQAAQPETRRRGLFGGKEETNQSTGSVILFKVVAPNTVSGPIPLHHLKSSVNKGIPMSLAADAVGQIRIDPARYKDWAPYFPSSDGISGPPLTSPTGEFVRFLPMMDEWMGVPIFIIEEKIDTAKALLKKAVPSGKTFKVILVGAKRSGKTTYVQALLNYLENQFAPRFGANLIPNPDSVAAKYRLNALHAFLDNSALPESTRSVNQFGSRPATKEDDPRIAIKFDFLGGEPPFSSIELYDVAGEDMDTYEDIKQYDEELAAADLVINLFDPLQLPQVAQYLRGKIGLPEQGTNPFTVLMNLAKVLNEAPNRNPNQKVAITVSKFDGLVEASNLKDFDHPFRGTIAPGMSVTRDPNSWDNKQFNVVDSWQVDQEVSALLSVVPALNPFVTAAKKEFGQGRSKFFVVSALGHATFAAEMDRAGITSYRVSDPIMWITNSAQSSPSQS